MKYLLAILLVAGSGNAILAQQPPTDTAALAAEAGVAYDAKDWAKAAALYSQLSKSPDAPPRVWLRLGAALRSLGKYDDALAAFLAGLNRDARK